MAFRLALCLVLAFLCADVRGFTWNPSQKDGRELRVCEGENVVLRLNYTLINGESEIGRHWDYETIESVVASHSGRYGLTVMIRKKNSPDKGYKRNIRLTVIEPPAISANALHVTSSETLVNITLSCGNFTKRGQLEPVQVSWKLPNSKVVPSTRFKGGQFQLILGTDDADEGVYTCQVTSSPSTRCLPAKSPVLKPVTHKLVKEAVYSSCDKTPKVTGVYIINIRGYGKARTECNHELNPGGWMYTKAVSQASILVVVETFDGKKSMAQLNGFTVGPAHDKYRLGPSRVTCGTLNGKWFALHNYGPFSTKDQDNDQMRAVDCANDKGGGGGWWYQPMHYCLMVNLNGHYYKKKTEARDQSGLVYYPVAYDSLKTGMSLKATEMFIRPYTLGC
ncbi:hypothetical protein BaRGS_00007614, partial [Batillaria attramentaria]